MSAFTNRARRLLIRFGKVCPFVVCFIMLVSYIENIIAIITNNIVSYGGILIYNTPISFAIGNKFEIDIFLLLVIALISISIEACKYNIMANIFCILMLLLKHYIFNQQPMNNEAYIMIMSLCSIVSFLFVYKGLKILLR